MKNLGRKPGLLGTRGAFPEANAPIGGPGGKQTAIGAIGERVDYRVASIPSTQGSSRGEEPGIDLENVITSAGIGNNFAVRSKYNAAGLSVDADERKRFFSTERVPKLKQRFVVTRK